LFNAWSLQKVRYTAGVDWKLSKVHAVGAFYQYQKVNDDDDDYEPDRHLLGITYKFKF
jgi:opacity protein-like surface antigen